jgi:anti-sigma factor RsiW
MKPLDEETLNAYCDGALDKEARAAVERQLQSDQGARRFVEAVREADRVAAEAFADPMHEAPPQALVDAIRRTPPGGRRVAGPAPWRPYALPLAASLALAIGLGAGFLFIRSTPPAADALALGDVARDRALHQLLETQPSGSPVLIGSAGTHAQRLSVVATFADRAGRPCREVELIGPGSEAPVAAAVACRNAGGTWVIEGATRLAQAAPSGPTQFQPSGVRQQDALEALLTTLGAKSALAPAEEQAWLQRQWKQ